MDANRFDAFVKALSLSAARRGMVAGVLGGTLASLLANLESAARTHTNRRKGRHDELSAEKRKRKKKKKHKKKPKPQDQAPPCTDASCPIPPGCSEQILEYCTAALFEEWLTAVEPCKADCAEPASAACQDCLKPILEARLPDAEACLVESCASSAPAAARHRAKSRASRSSAREWWPRSCDKPCCYVSWRDCKVDGDEALVECLALAFGAALFSGGLGAGGLAICMVKWVYQTEKCEDRYGCPNHGACGPDDSCCPDRNDTNCGGGWCCGVAAHCCEGGGCCNHGDKCCRRPSRLWCCPPYAQCMQTGIPCQGTKP